MLFPKIVLLTIAVLAVPTCWAEGLPARCSQQLKHPAPPGELQGISAFRQAVVQTAAGEIGVVSASQGEDGFKPGWEHLVEYFQLAWPSNDLDYIVRRFPKIVTRLDMLKSAHGNIAQWCGVFALWAVKKAAQTHRAPEGTFCGPPPLVSGDFRGAYLPWTEWRNGHINGLPYHSISKAADTDGPGAATKLALRQAQLRQIQPGDIVFFAGEYKHQAVVERIVGNRIYTIDGNTECEMVTRQVHELGDVLGYYQVDLN